MTVSIIQRYFADPITGKPLVDPVMNHCGHSYSNASLTRWRNVTTQNTCPFCRAPFESLIADALLQQAAALASTPARREYTRVDQFTDEDREIIEAAIAQINQRRELDQAGNFPSKLDPYFESSAADRASAWSKEVSHKIVSC